MDSGAAAQSHRPLAGRSQWLGWEGLDVATGRPLGCQVRYLQFPWEVSAVVTGRVSILGGLWLWQGSSSLLPMGRVLGRARCPVPGACHSAASHSAPTSLRLTGPPWQAQSSKVMFLGFLWREKRTRLFHT